MSSLAIAAIIFACILAGTLVGMLIARWLPEHHLSGDSKDSVKQGLALIATLTALVLGLLVATTKGTFDTQSAAVRELAANIVLFDRLLARYGPETKPVRDLIPGGVTTLVEQTWPEEGAQRGNLIETDVRGAWEAVYDKLSALDPKTDTQAHSQGPRAGDRRFARSNAPAAAGKESSIPTPFLFVLGFWLTILFGCYGLLSPRNPTVIAVLIVCMVSVSGAVFLVLEMDRPFEGIMRVSGAPLRAALSRLGD